MLIVGNLVGFVMLFVATAAWALLARQAGHTGIGPVGMMLSAGTLILLDLAYRKYRKTTLFGRPGGRLFFIPAWLFGIVLAVVGMVSYFRS